MELTFTELNDEPLPLLENQKKNPYKKPKISSYDDILTSLNLKVNNGKLEYIQPKQSNSHYDQFKTCYKKQLNQQKQQQTQYVNQIKPNPYQHNYIYNKYFKDYKEQTAIQEQEVVYVTPQEYKKIVILELLRRREEQKKIAQIKSKKLLFAQENNIFVPNINASPNNLNKLFRFSR